jgi:molecular chaperone HscB
LSLRADWRVEKVKATIASIKEALETDPPNLAGTKILSVQLKYWQGLEDAAKEWSPSRNQGI